MYYPQQCCQIASRKVANALGERFGVEEIAGYYTVGMMRHAWNYDVQRGLYIDLTLDQFYEGFPQVTLLPATVHSLLRANGSLTYMVRTRRILESREEYED